MITQKVVWTKLVTTMREERRKKSNPGGKLFFIRLKTWLCLLAYPALLGSSLIPLQAKASEFFWHCVSTNITPYHIVRSGLAASIPLYRSQRSFLSLGTDEERVIRTSMKKTDYAIGDTVLVPRDGTTYIHEAKVIRMCYDSEGKPVEVYVHESKV